MFCPKCGIEVQDQASFCMKCGTPVGSAKPNKNVAALKPNIASSTFMRALKASRIPAGIGAAIGISAAVKITGGSIFGKFILGLLTAAMIGIAFGSVAFVCVYGYLKLRGKSDQIIDQQKT